MKTKTTAKTTPNSRKIHIAALTSLRGRNLTAKDMKSAASQLHLLSICMKNRNTINQPLQKTSKNIVT